MNAYFGMLSMSATQMAIGFFRSRCFMSYIWSLARRRAISFPKNADTHRVRYRHASCKASSGECLLRSPAERVSDGTAGSVVCSGAWPGRLIHVAVDDVYAIVR